MTTYFNFKKSEIVNWLIKRMHKVGDEVELELLF